MVDLVERQMAQTPNRVAVEYRDERLSYGALDHGWGTMTLTDWAGMV